jgi:hypothetical protein
MPGRNYGHTILALPPPFQERPRPLLRVHRRKNPHCPRPWGAWWVACKLWQQLDLDAVWSARLPASREGTDWKTLLQILTTYRLLDPGIEGRLHRHWLARSGLGNLLGVERLEISKDSLYRCVDRLLAHRAELFQHLRARWQDLFGAKFDVLLYDLTSTYFESDPPFPEGDQRGFGHSRDKRPDCVQVILALIEENEPDRGPHLRGFSGVLLVGDIARAFAQAGGRADVAGSAGKVCDHADGGRPSSDERRTGAGIPTLPPTREGSEDVAGATGLGTPGPASAADHVQRRTGGADELKNFGCGPLETVP